MKTFNPLDIAARAGNWSARNRKKAIFGWLGFVLAALVLGSVVGTNTLSSDEQGVGESGRADRAIGQAFPKTAEEQVILQAKGDAKVDRPEGRAAIVDGTARLKRTQHVR